MKNGREGLPRKRIPVSRQFGAAALAVLLGSAALAPAVPPPTGVAPVLVPAGGFGIDGDLFSGTPSSGVGDWLASSNNIGGAVLDPTGVPLNPATTFHFTDLYNSTADNSFVGGLKWTDDPNTWQWTTGKPSGKTDINNVLLHFATDGNGHSWVIIAADRLSTSGDSYIDFEFLQNTLTANADGTFTSGGPNGGRTANDLLLSLAFTSGGSVADFFAWRWQTNAATGGFGYNDATASLPAGKVFVAANTNTVSVPFGAFGQNTYSANAFAEAALDLTALLGNFDPCLSIGVNTVMVKTKTSQSSTATISDFINPIQYTLRLGPSANAGPDQTQCALSAVTDFVLHGQATQGLLPIASTTWSVVNGSAVIDSPTSLVTTAHVASANATLRLTVVQANGCTETDDVVLSTASVPSGSMTGPNQVCPGSTFQFAGPAGMAGYAWSITGNGAISGPTNGQNVTVHAGSACGQPFTLVLNFSNSLCSSACTTNVLVNDTTPPVITAPADVVLECPADTTTNSTGLAMAQDGCSAVTLTYADSVTNTCGGTKVIARTWTATDACGNSANAVQSITVRDTTPPTITAPPAVTLECPADTSPNNTGMATAKDGCSSVVVTFSDVVSNSCGGTKLITRTWLATDACGNAASAVQLITVHDTTPPTITAPPNLVLECPADTTTNNTGVATAQDGCSSVTITYSDSVTNNCGGSKVIARTWLATDACGNSASAVQLITVHDTTTPTITAPPNLVLECPADTTTNNTGVATAQDGCSSVTITYSDSVTNNCGGSKVIARTWLATDACGNSASAVQLITVHDTMPPTVTAPPNLVLECPADTTTNNTGVATAQDGCSLVTITFSDSVTNNCGGSKVIARTWVATDACGNSASAVQLITVHDSTPPSITAPPNIVLECPADTTTNSTGVATAQDGCSSVTITYSDSVTNNCGGSKVIARTWLATDACGNSASAVQLITVHDTMPPTITAPPNLVLECPADTTTNNTGVATAQDGCSSVTITYSDSVTNNCGGSKVIARTWLTADACGNSASAVQLITVHDTTPPSITAPPNLVLECPADTTTNNTGVATAQDGCSSVTITYNDSVTNNCGGSKVVARTWLATDACGNSASAVQLITVHDTTPPSITAPPNLVLECPADTSTNNTGVAIAQDGCSSVTITYNDSVTNNCGGSKVIARIWLATDACGNSASAVQLITVHDTTPPTITAPPNLVLDCPADTTTNNTGVATATDGCSSVTITYSDSVTNNCGGSKVIARTWLATDACGNSASAVQIITVRDITPPSITAPPNLVLECPADTRTNATGVAMATDGCSSVTVGYSDSVTNQCGGTKVIARTWLATDACGNSASAVQLITVHDTTPPTITAPPSLVLECPADTSTNKTGVATATDGCSSVTISYSDAATNSCGGTKVITRTWMATDACGNSASAVQTITVQDTTPPTITTPPNLVLDCPADTSTNTTGVAVAHDGCSGTVVTYSDAVTNACGGTKTIARTWLATDACGNSASAVQMITVRDTTPPTITAPPNLVLECPADTTTNNTGVATAQDGCSSVTITYSDKTTNTCGGTKIIARTWMATDACGNSAVAVQTITVHDTTPPTITAPPNLVLECPADTTTNNTGVATAQDGCSAVAISYRDTITSTCPGTKVIARAWLAMDACGNSASAVQTITVQDTTPPLISVPPDLTLECGANTSPAATGTATAQDGCSAATVTYVDVVSNLCGGSKIITRIWTAADGCGNNTSGIQKLSVLDRTPPNITYVYTTACTYSQGGWGGAGTPGQLLQANFTTVFPNGAVLGVYNPANGTTVPNGLLWQPNAAGLAAFQGAISQGNGSGGAITQDALNPTGTYGAGGLGRQTMALTLNIAFNTVGLLGGGPNNFGSIIYTNGGGDSLSGMTISQILNVANRALAGLGLPQGYDFSALGNLVNNLNISFENCTMSSWATTHLSAPMLVVSCAAQIPPADPSVITAWDSCSGPVVITNLPDTVVNYVCANNFTVQRTWVATDACGNTNSVSYFIQVYDSTPPTLVIPPDLVLECPADTSTNSTGVATALDKCGAVTVTYSDIVSNNCAATKTVFRTWTASDGCNTTNGVQTITVRDTTPPAITAPPNLVLECPADTTTNNTGVATAQDGCSAVTLTYADSVTNTCGGTKVIARTWTATDACGNSASAVQSITVRDTTPPTITAPPAVTLECPADTSPNNTGLATAKDGCSSVVVTFSDVVSNSCGGTKLITRTWLATDACGNAASAVQLITVHDTTPPTITAPPNLVLECPADTTTNNTGVATAHDGCSAVTITYSDSVSNTCGNSGIITRTWTATDGCGNSASAVQTITVQDTTPPTLTIISNVVASAGQVWNFDQPVATDNCGSVTVSVVNTVTNVTGTNAIVATRTWSGTDACGNTSMCQQTVTVVGGVAYYQLVITQQPQSQTAPVGSDVSMNVVASGFGPSSYQWHFDGNNIDGATGSALKLGNVQFTNAGQYSVTVSNAAGILTSAPASLNVVSVLTMQPGTNGIILTWTGPFTLQSATDPAGPYTDVPGATSPYFQSTLGQPEMFFRLRSSDFDLVIERSGGNQTSLIVTGPPGVNFIIEASDDLLNWSDVLTNTAPCTWSDPAAPQHPWRMYRLRLMPISPNLTPLSSTPLLQIQASIEAAPRLSNEVFDRPDENALGLLVNGPGISGNAVQTELRWENGRVGRGLAS